MSEELDRQLERLRNDYAQVTGTAFKYFYCPTLRVDEDVPLCLGHIVNRTLAETTRKTIVQRQDLDGFYGRVFEADFQDAVSLFGKSAHDIVFDPELRKKVQVDLFLDGEKVEWYEFKGRKASDHFGFVLTHGDQELRLVFKANPIDATTGKAKKCTFAVSADLRVAALVSLIKAAHLTQFRLLGYRYGCSEAAEYVGGQILGRFHAENRHKEVAEIRKAALDFFRPYGAMMRPLASTDGTFTGTVDDNQVFACIGRDKTMFATGVFIRATNQVNMVMLPSFTSSDAMPRYNEFLNNADDDFHVKVLNFERARNCWTTDKAEPVPIHWPKNHPTFQL
jgi:hypothetical protein